MPYIVWNPVFNLISVCVFFLLILPFPRNWSFYQFFADQGVGKYCIAFLWNSFENSFETTSFVIVIYRLISWEIRVHFQIKLCISSSSMVSIPRSHSVCAEGSRTRLHPVKGGRYTKESAEIGEMHLQNAVSYYMYIFIITSFCLTPPTGFLCCCLPL